jgi:hypothetical protein
MRFMMIVKANQDSEAGVMPSEELLSAMGCYNDQLVKAAYWSTWQGSKRLQRVRESSSRAEKRA